MPVGADGIITKRYAANFCDFCCDLASWKNAALAGFRTLTHLDLEHAYAVVCGHFTNPVIIQITLKVTYPVFGRANLEDDIRATIQVVTIAAQVVNESR